MATDLLSSVSAPAVEAESMPHRYFLQSPPLAVAGLAVSAGSTAWSFLAAQTGAVFGAVDAASLLSLGGAVLAVIFGGLIPKGLDAWQDYRNRKRVLDQADRDSVTDSIKEMMDLQKEMKELQQANLQMQDENLRYQRENARLQKTIKDLLEQSSERVLTEVDHVLRNVKQGNNLGIAVGDEIAKQIKGTIEEVGAVAKSTNRKVTRVAEALSGSGVDLTATDADMPTVTPPPAKMPLEPKP